MRLIRSWPDRVPPGRAHVVDDIEHLVIDHHDYAALREVDDDVLLLEWDIAVGQEDLVEFARTAAATPGRVLVAPYRIYADVYGLPHDVWAHRTWDGTGSGTVVPVGAAPVATGSPVCQLFGLGMVYLPRALVRQFLPDHPPGHFGDVEFSMWHYQHAPDPDVPIAWGVRPVHLNYLTPKIG
jgi:hypothetical protein